MVNAVPRRRRRIARGERAEVSIRRAGAKGRRVAAILFHDHHHVRRGAAVAMGGVGGGDACVAGWEEPAVGGDPCACRPISTTTAAAATAIAVVPAMTTRRCDHGRRVPGGRASDPTRSHDSQVVPGPVAASPRAWRSDEVPFRRSYSALVADAEPVPTWA